MIAKFKVNSVSSTKDENGEVIAETYYMTAVYSADPEHVNYNWSKMTPSGSVSITVSNPALFDHFKKDEEITLTFSVQR